MKTEKKPAIILAIESSCDETAAAVVRDGKEILSNVVYSQIAVHEAYGGVVPEVASRKHLEAIVAVVDEAVKKSGAVFSCTDGSRRVDDGYAKRRLDEDETRRIDAVAATYGPGLVGALLVGLSFAKGLAMAHSLPFIGVHHVTAHIMAASFMEEPPTPPFTALVVSGGHSGVYHIEDYRSFKLIGRTRDDAAGEAFDKVARATGLGYPGGRKLELAAQGGDPAFVRFPRASFKDGSHDFSFSGVKTAALNYLRKALAEARDDADGLPRLPDEAPPRFYEGAAPRLPEKFMRDFYASYQAAIVDALVANAVAVEREARTGKIVVAGGVAANGAFRARFLEEERSAGFFKVYFPEPGLCTDNAAMVAARAYHDYAAGAFSPLTLNASPSASPTAMPS